MKTALLGFWLALIVIGAVIFFGPQDQVALDEMSCNRKVSTMHGERYSLDGESRLRCLETARKRESERQ